MVGGMRGWAHWRRPDPDPLTDPYSPSVLPYAGGGLNIVNLCMDGDSNTETGLNLGGGIRFPHAGATPFMEAWGVISDVDQFVVTGGFLFGSTAFH